MFSKYSPLFVGFVNIFSGGLLLCLLMACQSEETAYPEAEITELRNYKTFVAVEDNTVAVPSVIKYDNSSNLFVFDKSKGSVLELNSNGNIINEYGRRGRGPGEFLKVNNMFLAEKHLYVVDSWQFLIHKYKKGGDYITSMDYGRLVGSLKIPPRPFSNSALYAEEITNQPLVTLRGNVMLSAVRFTEPVQNIYELRNWEGNHMADIGDVPEGSSFTLDNEKLRTEVENREIPSFYKPGVIPVLDQVDPSEYFFIYNAYPRIEKYDTTGNQLWKSEITGIPEIDSIKTQYYETMDQMLSNPKTRIGLDYYVSGTSSNRGNLFLATEANPLYIHKFDPNGQLTHRYKLISEDVDLVPIFEIDFSDNRIFVVTEEAEIRAYPF